jgi:hypothetical protein
MRLFIGSRNRAMAAGSAFCLLVLAGCGSGRTISAGAASSGPGSTTSGLSLQKDLQPILTASCAVPGCHAGDSPQEGMDLSSGSAYSNLVNADSVEVAGEKRVKPNDPDHSFLFEKVSQDPPSSGSRMPLGGRPLTPDQIQLIHDWIMQGAHA